ncbi:hypothetical protein ABH931_000107 [Streptacidiphilus sp. MAP12-33]|uniref:hypothetical protein n=1 Tax=Streptacidiphilus sp. MAP12-33 TaxID=3156266 RepID=UPI003518472F
MVVFFGFRSLAAVLTAGVVGASALAAGSVGTASAVGQRDHGAGHIVASPPRPVTESWITGLPARVRRGSTVTFTLWYRSEHTRQSLVPLLYGTDIQNSGPWGAGQYRGMSFQFYDVATRRWERPVPSSAGADQNYGIAGNHGGTLVGPGALGHVTFRLHVGGNAYLGHWRIAGSVTGALMPSGNPADGLADITRFTITR